MLAMVGQYLDRIAIRCTAAHQAACHLGGMYTATWGACATVALRFRSCKRNPCGMEA